MGAVSSFNEWDPLEEVIVGSVRGAQHPSYEPALSPYFLPNERGFAGHAWDANAVGEAERQLDGLASLLERLGVTVRRPTTYPSDAHVTTPDFESAFGNCYACPRDVLLVVGDTIIDAPMSHRARFFEYRGYRDLLLDYFDQGARWLSAPKTLMNDASYRAGYVPSSRVFDASGAHLLTTRDICFDAACFARCGRDIFWQPDLVSNDAGANWLRRVLGEPFRIHRIEFQDTCPQHIDTTLVPLRPGLALTNPERPATGDGLAMFHRNGWKTLTPPPSVREGLPAPSRDVSNWISMNLLIVDPRTVIVEEAEDPMAAFLQDLGFSVLRCAFDKVYKFGGGFHCCTLDVRRRGTLESYFPSDD